VNNELNILFEAQSIEKKELHNFHLIIQTVYMQIHQVNATTDSTCNSVVTSKPKGCIIEVTQWFITKASILSKKWQDKVGRFQGVRKRALDLVP
jgi:hypothetical protein